VEVRNEFNERDLSWIYKRESDIGAGVGNVSHAGGD
jgi:hypothetical protein